MLKTFLSFWLLFTCLSCAQGKLDPFDVQNGLSRSEIKDSLVKNPQKSQKELASKNEAPIPNISKLILMPPPPVVGGNKTISFSVTEQVPLKDVLIELGRVIQIDVDLDSAISGGIILNAKNRQIKEIIDRIAVLGNLRYSFENNVLHFEPDAPYIKNYFVDYLIDGQLWSDVESNVTKILASSAIQGASTTAPSSISSNKSAGIISVFATRKEHENVAQYLDDVCESASAQVLIEAKIVEVALSEVYKAGINWTSLTNNVSSIGGLTGATGGLTTAGIPLFNGSISASVDALETFGTIRTIASPRINAINNQKASLNFGDTKVYFRIDANQNVTTTTGATAANTSTITSTKQEIDIGTKLDITPSINIKSGEIVMKIKPSLSVEGTSVVDPASPQYKDSDGNIQIIKNEVPQVNKRTMETMAKVKSGNILVIGGLMKDSTKNTDNGVPFLSRIPLLGLLFKTVSKDSTITETVIFIKATIIKNGRVDKDDRILQEKFDSNHRRFFTK